MQPCDAVVLTEPWYFLFVEHYPAVRALSASLAPLNGWYNNCGKAKSHAIPCELRMELRVYWNLIWLNNKEIENICILIEPKSGNEVFKFHSLFVFKENNCRIS